MKMNHHPFYDALWISFSVRDSQSGPAGPQHIGIQPPNPPSLNIPQGKLRPSVQVEHWEKSRVENTEQCDSLGMTCPARAVN